MAGNYPDVPSWRMAYDVDGTQVYFRLPGQSLLQQVDSGDVALMNDENDLNPPSVKPIGDDGSTTIFMIFPELRDLDGYLLGSRNQVKDPGSLNSLEVSANSTNGVDGTWVSAQSSIPNSSGQGESARKSIISNTFLGIKAIRWNHQKVNSAGWNTLIAQIYGEPSPGENLQRLEIWHPTLDERISPAYLDWGDVPRNSTDSRDFRVKNLHPTLTASSVRVAMSMLTDTNPSVVGQMSISKDGGSSWAAQQTLTNPLGPEAISPILKIRRVTPANAALSLWWYRVFADTVSWA